MDGEREYIDARRSGPGLGLAVADDADAHQIGLVHDRAERDAERVAQLAAFVDRARRLCINMAAHAHQHLPRTPSTPAHAPGEPARRAEPRDELREALAVARVRGPERRERVLEPEARQDRGRAVPGPDDVQHVRARAAHEAVRVRVDERETGAGAPVAQQARLDVVRRERALEEDVVLEEDHRWEGD